MSPRALPEAIRVALQQRAAQALTLARQSDPSCGAEAGAIWLLAQERPADSAASLASALRAQVRRERRVGGAHGPSRAADLAELGDLLDVGGDPAVELAAFQAVAARPGLSKALAQLEPALDARLLAERDRITLRRAQQILAQRRDDDENGQGVLL